MVVGDFQDMQRSLTDAKRLKREHERKRHGLVIEIVSWLIVVAGLAALILFKVAP